MKAGVAPPRCRGGRGRLQEVFLVIQDAWRTAVWETEQLQQAGHWARWVAAGRPAGHRTVSRPLPPPPSWPGGAGPAPRTAPPEWPRPLGRRPPPGLSDTGSTNVLLALVAALCALSRGAREARGPLRTEAGKSSPEGGGGQLSVRQSP